MDSRTTRSSRRDTVSHSSRDASSRSRSYDVVQHSNPGYDRAYTTHDAEGEKASSSGYNRAYNTSDTKSNYLGSQPSHMVGYSSAGYTEWPTDDAAGQGSSDRGYTTYGASHERSNISQEGQSSAEYTKRSTSYAASFVGFLTRTLGLGSKSLRRERTEQGRSDKSLQVSYTDRGRSFLQTIKPLEGDTTAIFEKRYTNTILRGGDPNVPYPFNMTLKPGDIYTATFVAGRENLWGSYFYRSTINPKNAEIDAHTMFKDRDSGLTVEGTSPLPASEILWHHYRMAASNYGLPEKPSRIKFSTIQNPETEKTLGPHFQAETSETVFEGDEKYYTIASTPIGKIPFYLTEKYYSDSKISKIEVIKRNDGNFGDITFYLEDKEDSGSKET